MILFDPAFCADELQRPFVQKGAAWLDETQSGWVRKIEPDTLRLSSCAFCICGQVFGSYMQRPDDVMDGEEYGFTIHDTVEEAFSTPCQCGESDEETGGEPGEPGGSCERMLIGDDRQRLLWDSLDRLWGDEVYWRCS